MKTKTTKITGLLITMMILIATLGAFSLTVSASTTRTLYIGDLSLYDQYTVDGVTAISGAPGDDVESYAHWDYESRTLTLKNFNQTITAREYVAGNKYYGISYDGNVNLVLIGDNKLDVLATEHNNKRYTQGIWCGKALTVTGSGSLSLSSPATAIFSNDGITLNCSGTIDIVAMDAGAYSNGIRSSGNIAILQGVINIQSGAGSLMAQELRIENAEVSATTQNTVLYGSEIIIKNSTVTAEQEKTVYYTAMNGIESAGLITIEDSFVTAVGTNGNDDVGGIGIFARGNLSIAGSTVNATGGSGIRFLGNSFTISNSTVAANSNGSNSNVRAIYGNGVLIDAESTVTAIGAHGAFDHAPTVEVNDSIIWYGADEAAANQDGFKLPMELSENYTQKYVRIEPSDHIHEWNEGVITTAPTCIASGEMTYTCTHNSAHTKTEDINALGHKYDNACDSECNTCGETRIPAEHHSENADGKCDECGESFELSGGAIAGIVIGFVAVLGVGGFCLYWFVIRKKKLSA